MAYNLVNSSWTEVCVFSTTCSVTVTDYSSAVLGNGKLQSRIYTGQPGSTGAGKYVYEGNATDQVYVITSGVTGYAPNAP